MPRFVLLTHDHPFPHWDLLLEAGVICRTWRLLEEPAMGKSVPAEPIADHRLYYLDYEGPVSEDRGTVSRWDHGTYTPLAETDEQFEVELAGKRLRGRCLLQRMAGEPPRVSFTLQPFLPQQA
jgi:hypothetical protein